MSIYVYVYTYLICNYIQEKMLEVKFLSQRVPILFIFTDSAKSYYKKTV